MLFAAGCGDDERLRLLGGPSTADERKPKIKVGLVTDIGGLNDRSFNSLANAGLEQAKSELGVEARVITSKSNADYVPNLSSLAQQKYDLVIGGRLPDGRGDRHRRQEVPGHQVRDRRRRRQASMKGKPTNVAGPASSRSRRPATWRATSRACTPRTTTSTRSPASVARRSRRSTTTSPATRPALRRPTPASRTSTATRRTSSIRASARSWR